MNFIAVLRKLRTVFTFALALLPPERGSVCDFPTRLKRAEQVIALAVRFRCT
jgi:hypothetical protein